MALSGSFYKNVDSHWRLQGEWSATQDISANKSTITLKTYWIGLDGYSAISSSATKSGSSTIEGTSNSFTGSAGLKANQKKLLNTQSKTITHGSDGTLSSVDLSVTFNPAVSLSGTTYGSQTASKTVSLNTIPRKSTLSSSPNFTAGNNNTVTISRASSSFTHKAYIDVQDSGGTWRAIKELNFTSSQTSLSAGFTYDDKVNIFKYLAGRSSMSTRINLHTYSGGNSLGYNTYTGTVSVPTASVFTSGTLRDVFVDSTIDLGIAREDSEFTHTLKIYANNVLIKTFTGIETSVSWTPTQAEKDLIYTQMANVKEVDGDVEIFTYFGTELVRSLRSNDINFHVRNSEPTFSSTTFSYEDNNATIKAITGDGTKIVQNASSVKVLLPAASKAVAKNKATISRYIATLGGQEQVANYSTSDTYFYFTPINAGVDQTLTIKAVDSRGFAVEMTKNVIMIPYQAPVLNASARRRSGFEDNTTLLASGSISPTMVNGIQKNTVSSVKYRYKKVSEAATVSTWLTWQTFPVTNTAANYKTSPTVIPFDNTTTWNVEMMVQDKFGSKATSLTVSTGKPILFIDATKKSVGVGKFPTGTGGLEVAGSAAVDGNVTINGGSNALVLKGGTTDYVYQAYYADAADQNKRTGYLGFGSAGNSTFTINNERGGNINLTNTGGSFSILNDGSVKNENRIKMSLQNGWTNYTETDPTASGGYSQACYWKDKNGVVHLSGLIKGGTTTNGVVVTLLPEGYRPYGQVMFATMGNGGTNNLTRVDVKAGGNVSMQFANSGYTSLDGISFKAER